jgi:hypothetical protein
MAVDRVVKELVRMVVVALAALVVVRDILRQGPEGFHLLVIALFKDLDVGYLWQTG